MDNDWLALLILLAYYLIFLLIIPVLMKVFTGLASELIRKTQHIVYSLSIIILLYLFSAWYLAIAAAFLLVLVAYPLLLIIESNSYYKRLFVDRAAKGGELRKQLIYVQLSFAILIFFFWGLLGPDGRYMIVAAIMAWGFGDAAAALVGQFYGQRIIRHHLVDGPKTMEGTIAMIILSFLAVLLTMIFYQRLNWGLALLVALLCGFVELFTTGGLDTLTVPLVAATTIYLSSLMGW